MLNKDKREKASTDELQAEKSFEEECKVPTQEPSLAHVIMKNVMRRGSLARSEYLQRASESANPGISLKIIPDSLHKSLTKSDDESSDEELIRSLRSQMQTGRSTGRVSLASSRLSWTKGNGDPVRSTLEIEMTPRPRRDVKDH